TNIPEDIRNEYGIYSGLLDSWFVGYTPQYALAVWTGYPSFKNKDGEPQYIIEDGTQHIAKQIFRKLMSEISDPLMDDFEKPDSVISIGSELYIEGTQPVQEPKNNMKNQNLNRNRKKNQKKTKKTQKKKKKMKKKTMTKIKKRMKKTPKMVRKMKMKKKIMTSIKKMVKMNIKRRTVIQMRGIMVTITTQMNSIQCESVWD